MPAGSMKFETTASVLKVDEGLGQVMGFAIVCRKNGEDYYDLHEDHIPEDVMLAAAAEFMEGARIATDMHARDADDQPVKGGSIVFMFPLTADIAKAFEIETQTTGLMIAMKPDSKEILRKYRDGTYTGFSIAGGAAFKAEG